MKKIGLISSAFLLTLALAACGGGKSTENTDSRSSAAESTTVESTKASATKESSSKAATKSSDAKPSGTTTADSKATASSTKEAANNGSAEKQSPAKNANPDDQANQVLNQLANMFPGQGLPQAILTSQTNNFLTAATTSQADQNNFRVLYARVNQLTPISSFEKKTYGSDAEAKNAVNQIIDNGGQPVDLGYNITGYKQGAAGSSYLSWQEGNWSLVVRASNINGESPDDLAKNVVNILEQETLPAPNTVGQITLNVAGTTDYNRNSVVWQAGTVVYSVHHFDPIQAVKMATSI